MESVHSKISGSASSRSRGWQLVVNSASFVSTSASLLSGFVEENVRPEAFQGNSEIHTDTANIYLTIAEALARKLKPSLRKGQ